MNVTEFDKGVFVGAGFTAVSVLVLALMLYFFGALGAPETALPEITSPDARFPAPEIIETSTKRRLVRWDFWANYEEHWTKALPIVIGEVHRVYDPAPRSWAAESHYGHYTAGDHCLMTGFETAEEAAAWLATHYLSMME